VVTAARRGDRIGEDALAPAVIDYRDALNIAAARSAPLRWVVVVVLVVAVATTLWNAAEMARRID
jgi:hypothetical protein